MEGETKELPGPQWTVPLKGPLSATAVSKSQRGFVSGEAAVEGPISGRWFRKGELF